MDEAIKIFWNSDTPPNVALEVFTDGKQRILPLELIAPHHDRDTATVTYEARFLSELSVGLGHLKPGLSIDIPATFVNPTIYIDADGCTPDSPFGGCGDTGA